MARSCHYRQREYFHVISILIPMRCEHMLIVAVFGNIFACFGLEIQAQAMGITLEQNMTSFHPKPFAGCRFGQCGMKSERVLKYHLLER